MRRVVALLVLIVGCSDGSVAFDGSTGGSLAMSSGSTSSSGAVGIPSTGGSNAMGGTVATGGAATGGTIQTGGSTPTGGTSTGGSIATDGKQTGGTVSTAGALTQGGTSSARGTVGAAGTAGVCFVGAAPVWCKFLDGTLPQCIVADPANTTNCLKWATNVPCSDEPCGRSVCLVQASTPKDMGYCVTPETCAFLKGKMAGTTSVCLYP